MQRAVSASAGIVVATAGLIAVTPVPPPVQPAAAVQMTGVGELFTPYADLLTHTWDNLAALGRDWFADPFPFAHQVLINQIGYAQEIFGALFSGDLPGFGQGILDAGHDMWTNFANVLHTAFAVAVQLDTATMFDSIAEPSTGELISALLGGNFHDLLRNVIDSVGNPGLAVGLPIAMLVNAIGAPYLGLTALVDSVQDIVGALRDGDLPGAFVAAFTAPAHLIDAPLNGSGAPLDILAPFGLNLDDLIGQQFDLGSEPVDIPLLGKGTAHLGDITVNAVGGNIPLGGLLAPLSRPDLSTTLQYSGGQVVFDERCLPIIGCSTPSPIDISSDPDTFDIARHVDGTPFGGILAALLNWLPQQFADAITPAG